MFHADIWSRLRSLSMIIPNWFQMQTHIRCSPLLLCQNFINWSTYNCSNYDDCIKTVRNRRTICYHIDNPFSLMVESIHLWFRLRICEKAEICLKHYLLVKLYFINCYKFYSMKLKLIQKNSFICRHQLRAIIFIFNVFIFILVFNETYRP